MDCNFAGSVWPFFWAFTNLHTTMYIVATINRKDVNLWTIDAKTLIGEGQQITQALKAAVARLVQTFTYMDMDVNEIEFKKELDDNADNEKNI